MTNKPSWVQRYAKLRRNVERSPLQLKPVNADRPPDEWEDDKWIPLRRISDDDNIQSDIK